MYVCICNGITDKQIRAAAVGSQCGGCADYALSLLQEPGTRPLHDESLFHAAAPA
jgi:bacterioferritin-associated ferredoxin